jgi:hypothetical protein
MEHQYESKVELYGIRKWSLGDLITSAPRPVSWYKFDHNRLGTETLKRLKLHRTCSAHPSNRRLSLSLHDLAAKFGVLLDVTIWMLYIGKLGKNHERAMRCLPITPEVLVCAASGLNDSLSI